MNIRPIETTWNGRRFRSRLEARWAVFFDSLGVRYEYEPEGFDMGEHGWYLPDFWLPHIETWVEIKPAGESLDDWPEHPVFDAKAAQMELAVEEDGHQVVPRSLDTRNPVDDEFVLIKGEPWTSGDGTYPTLDYSYNAFVFGDCYYRWCECPVCGAIGIEFEGRSERIPCGCQDRGGKSYNAHSPRLMTAYRAAMAERFDKGRR
ncbi:MAG: hypothetical protein M0R75_07040 [Dehalococcoidia bacterium]|nr:hypothetical protein [Dehalococcoidia bacterium]